MQKILILNGPNLNLLGEREPGIYGNTPMEEVLNNLRESYPQLTIDYAQSNSEGVLIDRLQDTRHHKFLGVILNAGAYTHTSLAIADCIRAIQTPVIEVHISNVHAREEIRRHSLIAPACKGIIAGFGTDSYRLALEALLGLIRA